MTWDVATPADDALLSEGDDRIRELRDDLEDALTVAGHFPIVPATPIFQYKGGRGNTASRPTNGEGGFYADTQTGDLLRDNGVSFDRIGTLLEAGTKAYFFQASAPLGWVSDTGPDGRLLSVDDAGGGGTSGSTWTITTGSDNANHYHLVAELITTSLYYAARFYTGSYLSTSYFDIAGARVVLYADSDITPSAVFRNNASLTGTPSNTGLFSSEDDIAHTHDFAHTAVNEHSVAVGLIATKS